MAKSILERKQAAWQKHDKLQASLEKWMSRLIRAAKKVESQRRQAKSVRGKIIALDQILAGEKERRRLEKLEARTAGQGSPKPDESADEQLARE